MKTLLVGMGNPILCDDSVGVRLARDFKRVSDGQAGLDVMEECSVGGLNLLDVFSGYDRIIVFDSMRTADGVPGEWYRFTAEALRETVHLTNIHDANFATALELGHRIGIPLPPPSDIHIFAVETKDDLLFSEQMTPELQARYNDFAAAMFSEVRELLRIPAMVSAHPER